MVRSARALLLGLVIAALVPVLAAGSGLAGLTRALAVPTHVCTCASGGSHARCPVCNPALGRRTSSAWPLIDGVPCGEHPFASGVSVEPALAASPLIALTPPLSRVATRVAADRAYEDVTRLPSVPPPRSA